MAKAITSPFEIKLAKDADKIVAGYNGSIKPLGERNDLDILMESAINSQSPTLIKYFEVMPTEEEWKKYKESKLFNNDTQESS